jgi:hypothetical protein
MSDNRTPANPPMTLHRLALALRGMPHAAPILIRLPDGTLRAIAMVGVTHLDPDRVELLPGTYTGDGEYAITLELREAAVTPGVTRPKP